MFLNHYQPQTTYLSSILCSKGLVDFNLENNEKKSNNPCLNLSTGSAYS